MRKVILIFLITSNLFALSQSNNDSIIIRKIYDYFLSESKCYDNLRYLCKKIGHRLSGSQQAEKAVEWAYQLMKKYNADTVYLQPVKVPVWKRGDAYCNIIFNNKKLSLNGLALGNSIGLDKALLSDIIEVKNENDLEKLGVEKIKEKIVFFNVKFNPKNVSTSQSYGETVKYRYSAASYAAKYGAKACLIRSMTLGNNHSPHTGNMQYDLKISQTKIPALALSFKDADTLSYLINQFSNLKVELFTQNFSQDSVMSYNVIAEIKGSQYPDRYITIGGHLDSWDVGEGAHDDGTGIVQSIEAIYVFKNIYKPKNTIRIVAFMNEENGLMGGKTYAKDAFDKKEKHLTAIETDAGGFTPRYIGVDTTNGLFNLCVQWNKLFHPYYIEIIKGGGGADISPLKKNFNIPLCGYEPDNQRYFDLHHTKDDVFENVHKRELELGGAAISSFVMMVDKYFQATN
ncbi:MAG TPA: M28 family peptidase [Bacteroidia bacterium]|nr:M28 family peptidase [Bacteroidia bacterium]